VTDNPHYVTPEEAKDMCCPISMMGNPHLVWKSCLGKRCMAWRWKPHSPKYYILGPTMTPEPHWIEVETIGTATHYRDTATHGYCGMVRHG